jgi:MFS family permease
VGTPRSKIPGSIWALGLVSLFMDMSSELIHSLLPVFLVSVLGASMLSVGLIEGVAEAVASAARVFSGALSDVLGRRKPLAVVGYGLAALSKPLFAWAPAIGWVFTARVIDRMGKGIRGAPRDALIGDIAPPALRGRYYGLRQSLDTVGAFLGPLLAIVLMGILANDIRSVFWFAVLPGLVSVAILVVFVREPRANQIDREERAPLRLASLRRLGSAYGWVVATASVLTLARFSEAFLVLRAENVGLALHLVPIVLVVMSVVYAASAYPVGILSDTMSRQSLLAVGFLVLIVADLVLALATTVSAVLAGVALWGLHMGLTQGLLTALVADTAPEELRGTAFGFFHLVVGLVLLAASLLAGWLWDVYGAPATFLAGAAITAAGLLAMTVGPRRSRGP